MRRVGHRAGGKEEEEEKGNRADKSIKSKIGKSERERERERER